jgi:hypothetical protein
MTRQFEYVTCFRKADKGLNVAAITSVAEFKNSITGEVIKEYPGHAYMRTRKLSAIEGMFDRALCQVFTLSELTVKENLNLVHSHPPTRQELISLVKAAYIGCSNAAFAQSANRGLTDAQLETLCSQIGIERALELGEAILVNSHPDPEELAPFASRLG